MLARPLLLAVAFCAFFFLSASDAQAQSEAKTPKKEKKEKKESELGDYDGVIPGNSAIKPPGATGKTRGKDRPQAYWVGFRPTEGGNARVFVQLGSEVEVQQWVEGKSLVVHLPKIRIGNRTVARFLDTRYFETALRLIRVKNARPRRAGKSHPGHLQGLQLRIDFKNPADVGQASSSVQKEADGYYYLYLDFVAGTDMPDDKE